jgi:F-type H+-transporting ATPase subunit c
MSTFRKALSITALSIATLCIFGSFAFASSPVATETAQAVSTISAAQQAPGAPASGVTDKGYIGLAIGLGLGIAAFGGAAGQGRAATAALEGIARNPGAAGQIFTPMILALALIESLVIYSLLIGFMLLGKM